MTLRTLWSVTKSTQTEQGESEEGTACAHWPAAPAVQVFAPIITAAYSEAKVLHAARPPSSDEPPAPVLPPVAPSPPVPLVPPLPGTYEQKPALPPSAETQVLFSAAGQRSVQEAVGMYISQPASCQAFSIVASAEPSVA
jgi:hypothetical protein